MAGLKQFLQHVHRIANIRKANLMAVAADVNALGGIALGSTLLSF
jgi:hypothetical protein